MASRNSGGDKPLPYKMHVCLSPLKGLATFGLFILLFTAQCFGAFDFKIASSRVGAMGDAFTGLSNDCAAVFINPAGLRQLSRFSAEFFTTNLYGLESLPYSQAALVLPTEKLGSFGIGYSSLGDAAYKETEYIFAHSFYLGEGLLFGYKIKSLTLAISGYGEQSVFGFDTGVLIKVTPELSIGVTGKNINTPSVGENSPENLPQGMNLGLAVRPLKGLVFTLDGEKNVDYPLNLKLGVDFKILPYFSLRTGLQSFPSRYSFGFGMNVSYFRLDYAFLNHSVLPGEHLFSLSVLFGKESEKVYEWKDSKSGGSRGSKKKGEAAASAGKDKKALPEKKININKASVEELQELPGMGKVTAERIVESRAAGAFQDISDLMKVPRMTKRTYSKIEPYITVGDDKALPKKIEEKQPDEKAPDKLTPESPLNKGEEKEEEPGPVIDEKLPPPPAKTAPAVKTQPVPAQKQEIKPETKQNVEEEEKTPPLPKGETPGTKKNEKGEDESGEVKESIDEPKPETKPEAKPKPQAKEPSPETKPAAPKQEIKPEAKPKPEAKEPSPLEGEGRERGQIKPETSESKPAETKPAAPKQETKPEAKPKPATPKLEKVKFINVNTTDEDALIDAGISPIIAENIIRFRDKKGGLKNYSELLDVPEMDEETYTMMKTRFEVK